MPLGQFDEHSPIVDRAQFDDGSTPPALTDMAPAGAYGARYDAIVGVNTGTVDLDLYVGLKDDSAVPQVIGTVTITAGAGWGTIPATDVLAALLPAAVQFILLKPAWKLYFGIVSAPATGTFLNILAMGGHF